jgi:uncharacterized membrane protein
MTDPQSPTAGKQLSTSHKFNKKTWEIQPYFENIISILEQKFVEHIALIRGRLFTMFLVTLVSKVRVKVGTVLRKTNKSPIGRY